MKLIPAAGVIGALALREAASSELVQVMNLVRAALQARYDAAKKPGDSYVWFDVEAMFADRVIVCKDGRYWQFGYSIDASNAVKLEEPKEVIEQFLPVKEAEATVLITDDASVGLVHLVEAAAAADRGKVWDVIIVRAGLSKNGVFYPDTTLREAVKVFEGARVYVKPDDEHVSKDKHDPEKLFGWLSDVKFVEGKSQDSGYLAGKLNVGAQFKDLRETIVDAWERGKRDLVGLSINAAGKVSKAIREGYKRALSIAKVSSVDLIVNPAAGGALVRLAESAHSQESSDMKEAMLAAIKAKFPQFDAANKTDAEIMAKYSEAVAEKPAPQDRAGEPLTRGELDSYIRLSEARASATAKINATTLPAPVKSDLVARFNRLERFTEADVDTEIKAERERVVKLAEALGVDAGKVKVAMGEIQVEDRSVRIHRMLDSFFNPGGKDADGKAYDRVHSFKECYVEITGDRKVTGRVENMDRSRLAESVGSVFREGVDTTAFANVLGTSLTRRMVQEYRNASEYDGWRLITGQPVPLNDFRTQDRVRFGGYGDLVTVGQGAAYPALASPSDEKAQYTPAKRGGTEDVTLEAIKNDDVGSIRRIPMRMARAAKRTLAKFVFDFIRTNPAIYDSVAFFHATHNNLGSTAFSAAEYGVVRVAMGKQTELSSADRLGIFPSIILYPLDLQETVWNAFQRSTNNDKTFVQQLNPTLVPVWYWTDTNDWAAMASPDDLQTIEIGFLDGQEEPQLFVQDMPNVGSMFSNDKLTYKIRHIYGGNVVDFRGAYKEVV